MVRTHLLMVNIYLNSKNNFSIRFLLQAITPVNFVLIKLIYCYREIYKSYGSLCLIKLNIN